MIGEVVMKEIVEVVTKVIGEVVAVERLEEELFVLEIQVS
jgi:hypothetical protein